MPTISDYAICIRRWDFSETSQTVSLFTRESGIIRGLAKGAKREKGKFSGGFDLLTLGQVVAIVKPGRDLATLTEWDLQETNRHLRANLKVNKTALYIADLIHHMLTDHDPHQALFDQLRGTLDQMRHAVHVADIRDVHLHLILETLDVEQISAVLRDEAIQQGDLSPQAEQSASKVRPDEPQAPGDQYATAFKSVGLHVCFRARLEPDFLQKSAEHLFSVERVVFVFEVLMKTGYGRNISVQSSAERDIEFLMPAANSEQGNAGFQGA